ncbi:hypothetical protein BC937DRAFT_90950 [Endogone sp. FLAS-F59071]|nr:hypothetical protein BC937DRAFT_90950 [Endogone sp. FLAS-F59071]|eukprot:RUS16663.1 hypothetical protein BC937DRAFT_90950 [Endogone sp. FLAS-F59071]
MIRKSHPPFWSNQLENGIITPMTAKSVVLHDDNASADENRDTDVVEARHLLEYVNVADTGKGVPDTGADETLAGGEEEKGKDEAVKKGECWDHGPPKEFSEPEPEEEDKAEQMCVDISGLIVEIKH